MSDGYYKIAGSPSVRAAQDKYGSRAARSRLDDSMVDSGPEPRDALTAAEGEFLAARDGFYVASVSASGWPYVQYRGGPAGFVRTLDAHTIAWPDFRGNRQYITTGNLADDDRVSLFFMDYPRRERLKIFGRARVVDVRSKPELAAELAVPGYRAIVERTVTVTVVSYDWNCPQHITPRFTITELETLLGRPVSAVHTDR